MEYDAIKTLIVDDEYLTRSLLRNCIEWSSLGFEIVGEAEDADEALNLSERLSPDVVFTDIQMPIIDGISLSEMIFKQRAGVKIVVLTGFDTFDYAQRCIKAGVSDYLLKPINPAEVLKTALKIKAQIERERKSSEEYQALRRQLYANLPFLRERFFSELLDGSANQAELEKRMEFLGIRFRFSSFQVASIQLSMEDSSQNEESRLIVMMKAQNYVKNELKNCRDTLVFPDMLNRIVILNNDENLDLYERCELLREGLAREASAAVCIGVGQLKTEIGKIGGSYRESLEALHFRIAVGNNTVILYDNIPLSAAGRGGDISELYVQLEFYLKAGLRDRANGVAEQILDNVDFQDKSAFKTILIHAVNIATACYRRLTELGMDPEEVYRLEMEAHNRIFLLDTLPDIKAYLRKVMDRTADAVNQHQTSRISSFIDDIKSYVGEHYAEADLTQASVAQKFFLNPSYLSRTFKKEAGVSFVEYLTALRMEKAIELLKNSDSKVFAVAEAVGVPDPNYFSTCFKKYVGLSVSDFRKTLAENKTRVPS